MIDCFQFYKALENTENLNNIVDDLSQGVNHEDHGGDPEEKDIVKYYHLFIVTICFRLISCTRMFDKHTLSS